MKRQPREVYGFGARMATRSPRLWPLVAIVAALIVVLPW